MLQGWQLLHNGVEVEGGGEKTCSSSSSTSSWTIHCSASACTWWTCWWWFWKGERAIWNWGCWSTLFAMVLIWVLVYKVENRCLNKRIIIWSNACGVFHTLYSCFHLSRLTRFHTLKLSWVSVQVTVDFGIWCISSGSSDQPVLIACQIFVDSCGTWRKI